MSLEVESNSQNVTAHIPDVPSTPLRFLWFVVRTHKVFAFLAIGVVIIASGLTQATSYLFKLIVDASERGDANAVVWYALAFPAVISFVQILHRLSGFLGAHLTTITKRDASNILVEYLLGHSHKYFSDRFSGSLMSKIGSVVSAVESFIPELLWTHISAIVSFIITGIFIWRADFFSGVCFALLLIVLVVLNHFFAKRKKELSYKSSALGTRHRGTIVDILSNIGAVRQFARTSEELTRVRAASELWRVASWASWSYTEKLLTANTFILFFFSILMFHSLTNRWMEGGMGTGDFVFILALYAQITGTLLFIGRAFNNTARSLGEMKEGLFEIIQPLDIVDRADAKLLRAKKGKIEWNNVTFKYEDNSVFDHFNLTIKAGERVGLVGSSGAGKTTFVSLLLRQHELNDGAILIDGQNIAEVTQDSLRENVAVVPQEPMLFHRSIRDNIAYGKPTATDKEIIAVAKKAQAHEFISALKDGYDTLVGERGVKLSGGQKQRVAIARAMLKNARVLVLDEATSALDSESEVAIQKALHELMTGKTVIAIAHRLSTLREMDRIIVLEDGKIIEDGNHDTLTKSGGLYARLWEHQAGGFLQD